MDDLRVAQLISLPKLRVYDTELLAYESQHPFEPQHKLVDKSTYLGIEVEVENVQKYYQTSPYWSQTEDGSLRNDGTEFVSLPIKAWRVEQALTVLFEDLNTDIEFTERTSIHVHMNIRTLTLKQLESLIITYIVFEKVLFDFVGENRYNNIFCVPIVETTYGANLKNLIKSKVLSFSWQKYTAMNAVPIWKKGTLEFRHLNGTKDIKRIITWINLLLSLKVFALQKSPEYIWDRILSLNTTSEYRNFAEEVFKVHMLTLWNSNFNKNIADCVSYIKASCLENEFENDLLEIKPIYNTIGGLAELTRTNFRDININPDFDWSPPPVEPQVASQQPRPQVTTRVPPSDLMASLINGITTRDI